MKDYGVSDHDPDLPWCWTARLVSTNFLLIRNSVIILNIQGTDTTFLTSETT